PDTGAQPTFRRVTNFFFRSAGGVTNFRAPARAQLSDRVPNFFGRPRDRLFDRVTNFFLANQRSDQLLGQPRCAHTRHRAARTRHLRRAHPDTRASVSPPCCARTCGLPGRARVRRARGGGDARGCTRPHRALHVWCARCPVRRRGGACAAYYQKLITRAPRGRACLAARARTQMHRQSVRAAVQLFSRARAPAGACGVFARGGPLRKSRRPPRRRPARAATKPCWREKATRVHTKDLSTSPERRTSVLRRATHRADTRRHSRHRIRNNG
ncbi:hypothetical protein PAPHI01_2825, partial [Pancytospora philotis]